MRSDNHVKQALKYLNPELQELILQNSSLETIQADMEILRAGQYVKVIPIVVAGLVKVFTRHEDKELLLYYIQPEESCIMSFSSGLDNSPSKVFAKTEKDSEILLVSVDKLSLWRSQFPDINNLFFQQFNLRYSDLLDTIHHVIFDKLDKRLLSYLRDRATLTNSNPIKISHRQIAAELGTSREVISRIIKKLEYENLLMQNSNGIEIF